jgi:hypothetical protein
MDMNMETQLPSSLEGHGPCRVLFVGIETEGSSVYNARIVEIGAILVNSALSESAHFDAVLSPPAIKGVSVDEAAASLRAFLDRAPEAKIQAFGIHKAKRLLGVAPWSVPEARWSDCVRKKAIEHLISFRAIGKLPDGIFKLPGLWDTAAIFNVDPVMTGSRALGRARATHEIYAHLKDDMNVADEAKYMMENGL